MRRAAIAFLCVVFAATASAQTSRRRAVRHPSQVQPLVYVAIFTHSEDPHHRETPDYSVSKSAYVTSRAALLQFAAMLAAKDIPWNWQSDWNFLNGVIQYEIAAPDATLLAATNQKNIVRYLKEDLGVEIDPHSHENDGYNYADVAYLIEQCGVVPSPVVGGHIYDTMAMSFQNWPRFNNGISGARYPWYFWKPALLMGAGTPNHTRDPDATGIWRPMSATQYFVTGGGGIAAFGNWDNDTARLGDLISLVETGALSRSAMWTAAYSFNQSDMVKPDFLQNTIAPALDRLAAFRDAGKTRFVRFEEALQIWSTAFGGAENVYVRPGS